MSILQKDWVYLVVPFGTASALMSNQSVSSTEYLVSDYVGDDIPIILQYPTTPSETAAIDIRVATASEVAFLKEQLYGAVTEPLKTTLFTQLLYGNRGVPLYVWTGGNYIAAWYGTSGLGFYVFVGYDSTNYPTQEIIS